jgi:hypothetical protein
MNRIISILNTKIYIYFARFVSRSFIDEVSCLGYSVSWGFSITAMSGADVFHFAMKRCVLGIETLEMASGIQIPMCTFTE